MEQETGDAVRQAADPSELAVDRILRRLDALDEAPVDEHAPVYDAVHRELAEVLAGGPADPATGPRPGAPSPARRDS
ncbi:hypothetical protein CLV35_1549 [Motilibacter peucedani]|uniref:Uncharacterized protein n=1 Tax=Motilibacter peucedani TaxID=598650 RepID=A0A420XSR4_9ACTN|nr:hypothetical protein [Motilibacter peucedani]RKS77847.1 hypothetical protein CLV35_1549 [Motilibacter peucedani]